VGGSDRVPPAVPGRLRVPELRSATRALIAKFELVGGTARFSDDVRRAAQCDALVLGQLLSEWEAQRARGSSPEKKTSA